MKCMIYQQFEYRSRWEINSNHFTNLFTDCWRQAEYNALEWPPPSSPSSSSCATVDDERCATHAVLAATLNWWRRSLIEPPLVAVVVVLNCSVCGTTKQTTDRATDRATVGGGDDDGCWRCWRSWWCRSRSRFNVAACPHRGELVCPSLKRRQRQQLRQRRRRNAAIRRSRPIRTHIVCNTVRQSDWARAHTRELRATHTHIRSRRTPETTHRAQERARATGFNCLFSFRFCGLATPPTVANQS